MSLSLTGEEIPKWNIGQLQLFFSNTSLIRISQKIKVKHLAEAINEDYDIFDNERFFPDYKLHSVSLPRYFSQRLVKMIASASTQEELLDIIQYKIYQLNEVGYGNIGEQRELYTKWFKSAKLLAIRKIEVQPQYELLLLPFLVSFFYIISKINFKKYNFKIFSPANMLVLFSVLALVSLAISYSRGIPSFTNESLILNNHSNTQQFIDPEDISYYLITEKYNNGFVVEAIPEEDLSKLQLSIKYFDTKNVDLLNKELEEKISLLLPGSKVETINKISTPNGSSQFISMSELKSLKGIFLFVTLGSLFCMLTCFLAIKLKGRK